MNTWIVGDIHGCALELQELLEKIQLHPGDRFISVGDLYHRGPDPVGVLDLLSSLPNFDLVLGNHERVMLKHAGIAGNLADGSDGREIASDVEVLDFPLLSGDGQTPIFHVNPARSVDLVQFLQKSPYFLRGSTEERDWLIVHAGVIPGVPVEEMLPSDLCHIRRLSHLPGNPYWYEQWAGPELVLFGHTPSSSPRTRFHGDHLVALGVDTGCVYGGALTAYCLESGEMAVVEAKKRWWA